MFIPAPVVNSLKQEPYRNKKMNAAERASTHPFNQYHGCTDDFAATIGFPKAKMSCCDLIRSAAGTPVYDPISKSILQAKNVIISHDSKLAYWYRGVIRGAVCGLIAKACILKRRRIAADGEQTGEQVGATNSKAQWEVTWTECAMKVMKMPESGASSSSCETDDVLSSSSGEDPWKEVDAMYFLKTHQRSDEMRHVVKPIEILFDGMHAYIMLPLFGEGDLLDRLNHVGGRFTESEARYWLKQVLTGILSLHNTGIFHRDISLENIMLHQGKCSLIDFGMSYYVTDKAKKLRSSNIHGHRGVQ